MIKFIWLPENAGLSGKQCKKSSVSSVLWYNLTSDLGLHCLLSLSVQILRINTASLKKIKLLAKALSTLSHKCFSFFYSNFTEETATHLNVYGQISKTLGSSGTLSSSLYSHMNLVFWISTELGWICLNQYWIWSEHSNGVWIQLNTTSLFWLCLWTYAETWLIPGWIVLTDMVLLHCRLISGI